MRIANSTILPGMCFDTLEQYFDTGTIVSVSRAKLDDQVQSSGIFVTYKHKQDQLRGCIGSVVPVDLWDNLGVFAVKAAVHDHRFDPLSTPIPNDLSCAVSLLHGRRIVDSLDELIVGKHGVMVKYYENGSHVSDATFLPDVIKEQRWGVDEIKAQLERKSGVQSFDSVNITVYESAKTPALLYKDYKKRK